MSELAVLETSRDGWTRERVDLVKKQVCPTGITDSEFEFFMAQCKRSGLDPLLKECFCVPRRSGLVTKHEFQPSEAGMLRRAEEFPDFGGVMAAAVFSGDTIDIDAGAGMVRHHFTPGPKRGVLIGAWAKLVRKDKLPIVVWLDVAAYQQSTPTWSKMPATMIEKCARVAAARKAYPAAFGGLYIPEEMPDDTQASSVAPLSQQMAATGQVPSRTEALKGQLRTKQLAAKTAKLDLEIPAPKEAVSPPIAPSQAVVTQTMYPPSATPWERILAVGRKHGKDEKTMGSVIRGATGKTSRSTLNDDDVALVEASLDAMAQMENEPLGE